MMSVAPSAQRMGVGKALLLAIREESRKLGITTVELDVWSANAAARSFDQVIGFAPVREVLENDLAHLGRARSPGYAVS